ncbi:Signal peptidase I [Minicystis rosea]|nr:Signal peptidase I [Minicystis rosea]
MKSLRTLLWTVVVLGAIAGIARLLIVDAWTIPVGNPNFAISTEPTLSEGDLVLMLTRGEPGFGDLVRCTDPEDPTGFVIGRVAGLSGDVVSSNGRSLTVNGKRFESEMACPEPTTTVVHPVSGEEVVLSCDQVQMGGRLHYRGATSKREITTPTQATIGAGMLFLLSDDRSYPHDSRTFGTVPAASCKSRIFFRVFGKGGWADDKRRLSYIR